MLLTEQSASYWTQLWRMPSWVHFLSRGWWYKHCEKRLPLKCLSFRERSNFPRIWFRDLGFRIWGLEINHLNAHNFVWPGWFFFHYYLATSTTNWAQIFTGLLFYAYVAIHLMRRRVFDNYQQCPVSLRQERCRNQTIYKVKFSAFKLRIFIHSFHYLRFIFSGDFSSPFKLGIFIHSFHYLMSIFSGDFSSPFSSSWTMDAS